MQLKGFYCWVKKSQMELHWAWRGQALLIIQWSSGVDHSWAILYFSLSTLTSFIVGQGHIKFENPWHNLFLVNQMVLHSLKKNCEWFWKVSVTIWKLWPSHIAWHLSWEIILHWQPKCQCGLDSWSHSIGRTSTTDVCCEYRPTRKPTYTKLHLCRVNKSLVSDVTSSSGGHFVRDTM